MGKWILGVFGMVVAATLIGGCVVGGGENRITVERKRYNATAQDFNSTRNVFPTNVVANWFGFEVFPYFKAEEDSNKAPKIDFKDLRK